MEINVDRNENWCVSIASCNSLSLSLFWFLTLRAVSLASRATILPLAPNSSSLTSFSSLPFPFLSLAISFLLRSSSLPDQSSIFSSSVCLLWSISCNFHYCRKSVVER